MKISALRIPAAVAACFAVALTGAPGASAAPSAPAPRITAGPTTTSDPAAGAVAATGRLEPVDDASTVPAGGTALVDVLANDGLDESAAVRLLLVDPAADGSGDELVDELRTDLGSLRVVSPDTEPGSLPEGWDVPGHAVLALTPAPDRPAGVSSAEVAYAVVDATGAEARAVLTLAPEDPGAPPVAEEPTQEPSTAEEPSAEPAEQPAAGSRATATEPVADVPAEIQQALEAAAARTADRTGAPTGPMSPRAGGWEWPHENGTVLWSQQHGAHFVDVSGPVGAKWASADQAEVHGFPVTDEICGMVGGGCRQGFANTRTVYWSPATGAHTVNTSSPVGRKWAAARYEQGAHGYPVTDEICGMVGGGCRQGFANTRTVYWSPATGAHTVNTNGRVGRKWAAARYEQGSHGYPVTDEICGMIGHGCRQGFQRTRTIYYSWASGAHTVDTSSPVGRKWAAARYEQGPYGYPVTDETGTGTVHQKFRNGIITWSASSGTRAYLFRGECHHLNTGRSVQPTRNAERVSLTIAEGYGRSQATFVNCVRIGGSYVEEWRTSAYVGASGFKRPGVPSGHTQYLFSPQGSYSVTESFGVYDPGTALPYRQLNPSSRWGGRPGALYNKYFESSGYTWPDENMWYFSLSGDYRLGVVINYNRPPDSSIVQGNGFAIFLHANKKPTAGCIALHEHEVARYMRTAQPGDRIIMGVRADLFR